jgi:hypothetical protein
VLARPAGGTIERRHDTLSHTAGLNDEVFDALVLLAAGEWAPKAIAKGFAKVQVLQAEMAPGRRRRLERLGYTEGEQRWRLHVVGGQTDCSRRPPVVAS